MNSRSRKQVAILGGGAGALSTAFWLSATPELRARFEISVHCQGHRLGGKGASGRNARKCERIEEHGLHVMMGFYDTVFATVRACFGTMPMPDEPAFPDWQAAFETQRSVTLWCAPRRAGEPWRPWEFRFPPMPGQPGDTPLRMDAELSRMELALQQLIGRWIREPFDVLSGHFRHPEVARDHLAEGLEQFATGLSEPLAAEAGFGPKARRDGLLQQLEELQGWLDTKLGGWARRLLGKLSGELEFEAYKAYVLLQLAIAGTRGFLSDVLPYGSAGLERINRYDFREWLRRHGASEEAVNAPPVMCLYSLGFAYRDGDASSPDNGQLAAGAVVYTAMHMAFLYRDAPLYRMKAGMGDVIFTPLYEVLSRLGVRFEFFQRVTALGLSEGKTVVNRIEIQPQARILKPPYRPLRRLRFSNGRQWNCWPAEPDWSQLADGEALRDAGTDFDDPWQITPAGPPITLKRGKDFDLVVLAIPPAAAASLSAELSAASPQWKSMLRTSHAVATASAQLWFDRDDAQLGWTRGATIATTCAEPFDSWATMNQLLDQECWPASTAPRAIAYYCGCLAPETAPPAAGSEAPKYLKRQRIAVSQAFTRWMDEHFRSFFPLAGVPGGSPGFDWSLVESSYFRANIAPSELYVQSFPKTLKHRLAPGSSGFTNLFLAGDWTRTAINGGCAEAAFQSGLLAAQAISGLDAVPEPDLQP